MAQPFDAVCKIGGKERGNALRIGIGRKEVGRCTTGHEEWNGCIVVKN